MSKDGALGIDLKTRTITVDNTALDNFRVCPKKYQYRNLRNLVKGSMEYSNEPPPPTAPLFFGGCMHKALDTYWATGDLEQAQETFLLEYAPVPEGETKRTPERGRKILEEYDKKYSSDLDRYESITCETTFSQVLETKNFYIYPPGSIVAEPWTIIYTGVIDKMLFLPDGSAVIMDHKTTSWRTETTMSAFEISNQFAGYLWASEGILGQTPTGLILDLIVLNPKNNAFEREAFARRESRMQEWKTDVLQTCRMMLGCYFEDRFPMYAPDACGKFNSLCPFFSVCTLDQQEREDYLEFNYVEDAWSPLTK